MTVKHKGLAAAWHTCLEFCSVLETKGSNVFSQENELSPEGKATEIHKEDKAQALPCTVLGGSHYHLESMVL